ncbi:hypothetical protein Y032_0204g1890 [Ancylostoma ceylanicum]|uniref:Uncharacterized protein n=1 Tax=Ancylostoma ceylanicum TaxID=53326 RepID=A0A016SMK7_9BILA|nr:hypothetical protein Y032_0204g1890 [Ancylostoma ceylanicum]
MDNANEKILDESEMIFKGAWRSINIVLSIIAITHIACSFWAPLKSTGDEPSLAVFHGDVTLQSIRIASIIVIS